MKNFFVIATLLLATTSILGEDAWEYLAKGNEVLNSYPDNPEKGWHGAAPFFWKAATLGHQEAIKALDIYYANKKWHDRIDRTLPSRFFLEAAARDFKNGGYLRETFNGTFIVVASKEAIIERLGLNTLLQKRGTHKYHDAIKKLHLCYEINGIHGVVPVFRAPDIKGFGQVALIDQETAKNQFIFTEPPTKDWCVYVQSPMDPYVLIPFSDFHRYVYETKMKAFMLLCSNLGAKDAEVFRVQSNSENTETEVRVNGRNVATYAEVQAYLATQQKNVEKTNVKMEFNGGCVIRKSKSAWLAKEPTWQAMQEIRLKNGSGLQTYTAEFLYTQDYSVNAKSAAKFQDVGFECGVAVNAKKHEHQSIKWRFHVNFSKSIVKDPRVQDIDKVIE